jgi:hypothetical protein
MNSGSGMVAAEKRNDAKLVENSSTYLKMYYCKITRKYLS